MFHRVPNVPATAVSCEVATKSELNVVTLAEGYTPSARPVFSKDGEILFLISGDTVQVRNVKTGLLIHTLCPYTGRHTAIPTVTRNTRKRPISILLNPKNSLQLLCCTEGGFIEMWDYLDATLLKSQRVSKRLRAGFASSHSPDSIFLVMESRMVLPILQSKKPSGEASLCDPEQSCKSNPSQKKTTPSTTDGESPHTNPTNHTLLKNLPYCIVQMAMKDIFNSHTNKTTIDNTRNSNKKCTASHTIVCGLHSFRGVSLSLDGQYMAVCEKRTIHLFQYDGVGSSLAFIRRYDHNREVTCVALNTLNQTMAVGDCRGKIFLQPLTDCSLDDMKLPNESKDFTKSRTLHWHAHTVSDVLFSSDGTYLVSVGEEGVLVQWHLDTGDRQFLPRLGEMISNISQSEDGIVLSAVLSSGSIQLINLIERKVMHTIQVVRSHHTTVSSNENHPILSFEPRHGHIVLRGAEATLHFIETQEGKVVREIDICSKNRVVRTHQRTIPSPTVTHVAFNKDGKWMATLDLRQSSTDEDALTEWHSDMHLKFWLWHEELNTFVLINRIDAPHDAPVIGLIFADERTVITASTDGSFKVWRCLKDGDVLSRWVCQSVGSNSQQIPLSSLSLTDEEDGGSTCLAASSDGSLMAIANGRAIHLWAVSSNEFQTTLIHPMVDATSFPNQEITCMAFLAQSPYFVSATSTSICVWDLRSCLVIWSYRVACPFIFIDKVCPVFVVIFGRHAKKMALFDAYTPKPLVQYRLASTCCTAQLIPWHAASSSLYKYRENEVDLTGVALMILSDKGTLQILCAKGKNDDDHSKPSKTQKLVGKIALANELNHRTKDVISSNRHHNDTPDASLLPEKRGQSLLDHGLSLWTAPSHTLPPVSSWFMSFATGFLPPRQTPTFTSNPMTGAGNTE